MIAPLRADASVSDLSETLHLKGSATLTNAQNIDAEDSFVGTVMAFNSQGGVRVTETACVAEIFDDNGGTGLLVPFVLPHSELGAPSDLPTVRMAFEEIAKTPAF